MLFILVSAPKFPNLMPYLHLEAASNLSDFFFLFHFHGLNNLPRAENLLFLSKGGVLVPDPRLFVRMAAPFCFFAARNQIAFVTKQ
jgi:hypothetical protein